MELPESIQKERDRLARNIEEVEFDYEYPQGLDLRPKTDLHKYIVREVLERTRQGINAFKPHCKDFQRMDWVLTSYMPADEADAAITEKDWRKPVNVVVPMTFASLEMYQTYFTSVFLTGPIHSYRGLGDADSILSAMKHEMLVDRQAHWFHYGLRHNVFWRDSMAYGRGAMALDWEHQKTQAPFDQELGPIVFDFVKDILPDGVKEGDVLRLMREKTLFEGTKLRNLDPYRTYWDPNVAPNDIQDGTFVGWVYTTDSEQLLKREFEPESGLFNCKYAHLVAAQGHGSSAYYNDDFETGRNTRTKTENLSTTVNPENKRRADVVTHMAEIIPSEWGLGDEDYPVKWLFSIMGDRLLIQCEPLALMHGMFPVVVNAPNTDGYSVYPVSHLMTTYGMQLAIDWFNKSHTDNVRKAINDMIIFDPGAIEEEDIRNPAPGKLIRLTRSHMNRGVNLDAYIKQLQVSDVTSRHPEQVQNLIDLMRQANGTVDIIQGDLSKLPERPTAAGINAATSGALSRLQRLALIVSEQAMDPLGYMLAYNNIQYLDEDMVVPLIGRHEERLRRIYPDLDTNGGLTVSKWDLDANFSVVPYDGAKTQPADLAALDTLLTNLLQVPENQAELAKRYPIALVFQQWLRKHGANDIAEMEIQTETLPDQQVAQEAQAGNLVSTEEVLSQQGQPGALTA